MNRRRHPRMSCDPTIVHVQSAEYDQPVPAQMLEASHGGLQLQVNEPLPVGSTLLIDTGQITLKGEVRHCQIQPDFAYIVGVSLVEAGQ